VDALDGLMAGKRGLVMGVANDHSIAWGIACALKQAGAELAFTYQGEPFGKRVKPLAEAAGAKHLLPCDVEDADSLATVFQTLGDDWGTIDFVVHAIAFSDKEELKGRYLNTSRDNFRRTLLISCYSLTEVARLAQPMMNPGGAFLTLSYLGAERVTPNYNVMGVAKAALECSVRYLAADLGGDNVRINCISAGPVRTLAGSAIADARFTYGWTRDQSPLRRPVNLEDVGRAGLYLLSDLAAGVTGEVHYVDAGYHVIGIPSPRRLTTTEVTKAKEG